MTSSDTTSQYCGSKFILNSKLEYESLEPLVEFLAFLVQKLCYGIYGIFLINIQLFLPQLFYQKRCKVDQIL